MALHLSSETKDICDLCGHTGIKKMLGKPIVINKKQIDSGATGDLTNEFIEVNRELLKEMKEEASNGLYE